MITIIVYGFMHSEFMGPVDEKAGEFVEKIKQTLSEIDKLDLKKDDINVFLPQDVRKTVPDDEKTVMVYGLKDYIEDLVEKIDSYQGYKDFVNLRRQFKARLEETVHIYFQKVHFIFN